MFGMPSIGVGVTSGADMKIVIGSLALAAMIAGPAMAADMPLKAPPQAPVAAFSWTGCYVGAQGGGAWGHSQTVSVIPAPVNPAQAAFGNKYTPQFDLRGGEVGIGFGCNVQFDGNWVIGLEGDSSWTNKKGSSFETGPLGLGLGLQTVSDETREKRFSTARARVGWAYDRMLLYVTGGLAIANVQSTVTIPVAGFPISNGVWTDGRTHHGWTVGAGIEYAFWNNWSFKAEYLYVKLENEILPFLSTPVQTLPRGGLNVDNNIVRAGVNWRFGCLSGCSLAVK
jgi:outer membrane immunogenic protein